MAAWYMCDWWENSHWAGQKVARDNFEHHWRMALSFIRLRERMLFPILSGIQHLHLFTTYVPFIQKQYAEIISFIDFIAVGVISAYYTFKFMFLDRQRRHLSNLFRGWQFYTTIVLVPSIICAFGIQASLAGKVLRSRLPNNINAPLCTTPILLVLLVDNRRWFVQLQE